MANTSNKEMGILEDDEKELTGLRIQFAENGFVLEKTGPGYYDEKPAICSDAEELTDAIRKIVKESKKQED